MLDPVSPTLLPLAHAIGLAQWTILGEGNVSARIDADTFLVKASGTSLATLKQEQLTTCQFAPLLQALDRNDLSEEAIEELLLSARTDAQALKPSVETFFHAYLLTLPEVGFVGHSHPIAPVQILSTKLGRDFAEQRRFPDEVVCCGPVSLLVPYVDPGLPLAQTLRHAVTAFRQEHETLPRVILLENHGVITLGASAEAVRAAMAMTVKAAEIFVGTHALGGPVNMPAEEIKRIENRLDEAYRRKQLGV